MNSRAFALSALLVAGFVTQSLASDPTVYVTKEGKKYHTKNCRLKHGSTGVKLSVAKKRGYTPCISCKPPRS